MFFEFLGNNTPMTIYIERDRLIDGQIDGYTYHILWFSHW